jgi:hypothetical protein
MHRETVIRPLAEQPRLSAESIAEAAYQLWLSRSVLYTLLQRYRRRPQTSSLLPWKRGPKPNESLLGDEREALLNTCIGEWTGMLAVPVLAGSSAYAIAEGAKWRSASLNVKPQPAPKFYAVIPIAILVGVAFDFVGLNAVKMLFWSAILNGLLSPPLVIMVVLLTSDRKVMGDRVNSRGLQALGWICALTTSATAIALLVSLR